MKRHIIFITRISTLAIILFACKSNVEPIPTGNVELFLLESFNTIDNTFQIVEPSVVAKETPLVYYSDFISYDPNNYIFKLSDNSKKAIEDLKHSVHGLAFAIMEDNKLVYTGYFWPSYSSMSCDWAIMDPFTLSFGNELKVELGYPGQREGVVIPDKRNDKRILDVFRRDGKLIDY